MSVLSVCIMRGQIIHPGHESIFDRMAKETDVQLVCLGSSNRPEDPSNPFSYRERTEMIGLLHPSFATTPIPDVLKDSVWKKRVTSAVREFVDNYSGEEPITDIKLYGHTKENEPDLLEMFAMSYDPVACERVQDFHATDIRTAWLKNGQRLSDSYSMILNQKIVDWLNERKYSENLQADWLFYNTKEPTDFSGYKHPETLQFLCADSIVVHQGKVLVIRRKNSPGQGQLALPGGHKENNETCLDCAIRELLEESEMQIDEAVLRASLVDQMLNDDPGRNLGITRVSVGFLFDISALEEVPNVFVTDETTEAMWIPLEDIEATPMFCDHALMIEALAGWMSER